MIDNQAMMDAEAVVAPATPSTPEDYDRAMETIVVQAKRGYADQPDPHNFLAEEHRALLDSLHGGETESSFDEVTKKLNRSTLRYQMMADAREALLQEASERGMWASEKWLEGDISSAEVLALASQTANFKSSTSVPEDALFEASVELHAPLDTPSETKRALVLRDKMLFKLAERVGDRKFINLGTDNYLLDLLAHLPDPTRQLRGLMDFGLRNEAGAFGYFDVLRSWQKANMDEREAMMPEIEQRAWEAAGNNALVYSSIIMPFLDEDDEMWTKISVGIDVADTVFTVGALAAYLVSTSRIQKSKRLMQRSLKLNDRLAKKGDTAAAATATKGSIAKKDPVAVMDGSPMGFAKATEEVTPEVARPTIISFIADWVKKGRLEEGQDIIPQRDPLVQAEKLKALERVRGQIHTNGTVILNEAQDAGSVTFTVSKPAPITTPIGDVRTELTGIEGRIKAVKSDIRLMAKSGTPTEEKAAALEDLKALRDRKKDLTRALREAKKYGEGVKSLKLPGMVEDKVVYRWQVDDAGNWVFRNDQEISAFAHATATPEAQLGKISNRLTSVSTMMRQQQRRLFGVFDKKLRKIRRTLSGKRALRSIGADERYNVESLLLTGDRLQRTFTEQELRRGVEVDNLGVLAFNEKEIAAYQQVRDMFDDLYVLADMVQREELTFAGYRMFWVNNTAKDGTKTPVRVFAKARMKPEGGGIEEGFHFEIPSVGANKVRRVVDTRTGEVTDLSSVPNLKQGLENKRYAFVQLRDDLVDGDGSEYRYGLVELNATGDFYEARHALDIDSVLDYRKGYVPKLISERISHVAMLPKKRVVNGVEIADRVILRAFDSGREAEIFRLEQISKNADTPVEIQQVTQRFLHDNPREARQIDDRLFRGAFVGHRDDTTHFKMGLEGREAERIGAFEALQRYADFVAVSYPMHQWKQAMIKRFLDDAKPYLEMPSRWDSTLQGEGPEYKRLKNLQDLMRVTFAVPTQEETTFNKIHNMMMDGLDSAVWNTKTGKMRFGGGETRELRNMLAGSKAVSNPLQAVKGATFHMMMGVWNVRQLFIQSAGMLIPATIHPLDAATSLPEFLYLRTASVGMDDINKWADAAGKMGYNTEKMRVMLKAWDRSGIKESILENADFGVYAGTHGAYYSSQLASDAKNLSLSFYNLAELNNRAFSFTVAFNRLASKHGWDLTKNLTDNQLMDVVQEALRIGTNMGPANQAKWQKNAVTGLMTQFWQQTHKYYENLFYGLMSDGARAKGFVKENQWTQAESMTALGMNLLMYGLAGFSIDELYGDFDRWVVDKKGGLGLDPEKDLALITTLRGGLTELLSLEGLGWTLDVADSIGPASGVSMAAETAGTLLTIFKAEPDDIMKAMVGASGTLASRWSTAFGNTLELMRYDTNGLDWDENLLYAVGKNAFSLTNSYTNIEKARIWSNVNDITYGRYHRPLFIVEDGTRIPVSVLLARSAGFDPLSLEKKMLLMDRDRKSTEELADRSKAITELMRKVEAEAGPSGLNMEMEIARRTVAVLRADLSEYDDAKVMDNVYQTLNEQGIDRFDIRLFKKFLEADPESEAQQDIADDIVINQNLGIK